MGGAFSLAAATAPPSQEARRLLTLAAQCERVGSLDEAERLAAEARRLTEAALARLAREEAGAGEAGGASHVAMRAPPVLPAFVFGSAADSADLLLADRARALLVLGSVAVKKGEPLERGLALAAEALSIREKLAEEVGGAHGDVVEGLCLVATILDAMDFRDAALAHVDRAVAAFDSCVGAERPVAAHHLARAWERLGEVERAREFYAAAVRLASGEGEGAGARLLPPAAAAAIAEDAGAFLVRVGRVDESIAGLEGALRACESAGGDEEAKEARGRTLADLGKAHAARGEVELGLELQERGLESLREQYAQGVLASARRAVRLAETLAHSPDGAKRRDAVALAARGAAGLEATLGADHPESLHAARVLKALQRAESGSLEFETERVVVLDPPPSHRQPTELPGGGGGALGAPPGVGLAGVARVAVVDAGGAGEGAGGGASHVVVL